MELYDVMRTTAAIRAFSSENVSDEVLYRVLDNARFAPSGANNQSWIVVVVKNPESRKLVEESYVLGWREYMAFRSEGLVAFSADADGIVREPTIDLKAAREIERPNYFVDSLSSVPVMLVLGADMGLISFMDYDLSRQSLVGGASVYPFAHNIMLAARREGLGGVMTTIACREEDRIRDHFGLPARVALAGVIALGVPSNAPTRLRRKGVEEFSFVDRYGGDPFSVSSGTGPASH